MRLRDTELAETAFRLKLGVPVFLLSWFVLRYVLARGDISRGGYLFLVWVVAPFLSWLVARTLMFLIEKASHGLLYTLVGTGGEPHSREYSEQQALVVAGRLDEAVDSYRSHLVAFPDDSEARLRLGALLAGPAARPDEAERVFLEVRERRPTPRQESVVGNALIDLYRRTGRQHLLRAELARYARLHPGTSGGEGARRLLRELVAADQAALGDPR